MTFKSVCLSIVAASILLLSGPAAAAQEIATKAKYAVMMDADTGQIFYSKDGDVPMPPASMSKLMTVAVLFDAIKQGMYTLDDTFPVSRKAWQKQGSKMWVMVNSDIAIGDLLRGIIVQSGNDACIVVAEGMSGSEEAFAERMNAFGKELGLTNSHFSNSTGWPDPGQRMSARDLAVVARYIIEEHPDLYSIFAETEFVWSDIRQPNRNPLLLMNMGADGLKTGHTEESGYGLVGSAVRNDRRVIVVLNGMNSKRERAEESRRMMNIAFREYKRYDILTAEQSVGRAQVWKGVVPRVPLMVKEPVSVTMHRRAHKDMVVKINYVGPVQAPVGTGDKVGTLTVTAPDIADTVVPVYAGADVAQAGFMGRLWEALAFKLYGLREG